MIWLGNGGFEQEEWEPALRSCWECNTAHERLKVVNTLHVCHECGRYWVFDKYLSGLSDAEADAFMESFGLKCGESTTKIDRGYRVVEITIGGES